MTNVLQKQSPFEEFPEIFHNRKGQANRVKRAQPYTEREAGNSPVHDAFGKQMSEIAMETSLQRSDPKGIFDPFMKFADRWSLTHSERCQLLSIGEDSLVTTLILSGYRPMASRDLTDRATYLVGIGIGLFSLFGGNVDAERRWLDHPRGSFNGKSAFDYMLEGPVINIYRVLEMLNRERGL